MPYLDGIKDIYKTDNLTGYQAVLTYSHHEIHDGKYFRCGIITTSGTSLVLAFKTPNLSTKAHMTIIFGSESKAHIEVIEGASWDSGSGSKSTIFNRNRDSTNQSILLEDTTGSFQTSSSLVKDPDNVAGGTVIGGSYVWATRPPIGQERRDLQEFITKSDETYVIKLTSDDGAKGLLIALNWYEHK